MYFCAILFFTQMYLYFIRNNAIFTHPLICNQKINFDIKFLLNIFMQYYMQYYFMYKGLILVQLRVNLDSIRLYNK